ncbi:MAG: alpha-L-arabinofuranosidase, partial [Acidobacteria bacterium]
MTHHNRRAFIGTALSGTAGLLLARPVPAARAQTRESRIDILVDEPIGAIAPEIYGHFVEHLGGVVYDGIWVGEQSRVANVDGIRKALVDRLKTIKPAVIRWPGGCFADSYDWHDGVGAPEKRPRRTDFWVDTRPSQDRSPTPGPQR